MADRRKIVKVLFEYEDGEVQWLDGDEADKWDKFFNGFIIENAVRKRSMYNPPKLNWQRTQKPKE